MRIGEKYLYKDRNGNYQKSIWIESCLDMARYFNDNVLCPNTGFSLVDSSRLKILWKDLDWREKRLIYIEIFSQGNQNISPIIGQFYGEESNE